MAKKSAAKKRERDRAYQADRRAARRAAGLCIGCGAESPEQARCAECRAGAARKQQARRRRNEERGRCKGCGTPMVDEFKRCADCRAKGSAQWRGWSAQRQERETAQKG